MDAVVVRDLVKTFDNTVVLRGVNLIVPEKIIYGLLGPNGAGKTTLLSILSGIIKQDSGEVKILGSEPTDPAVKARIGYCPQDPGLIDNLSGYDNALFYGRLYGLKSGEIVEKTNILGEKLGLSRSDLKKKVGKYSGGMKKKLALIISLIHDPDLLILDEPTTGMDPGVRRDVWDLLLELKREKTIILATHYMEEADKLSDCVGIIDRGQIIAEGNPEELTKKYGPRSIILFRLEERPSDKILGVVEKYSDKFIVEDNILKVHVEDPDKIIPEMISLFYTSRYRVLEFKLVKPTLEDVFLRLTGRRIEE